MIVIKYGACIVSGQRRRLLIMRSKEKKSHFGGGLPCITCQMRFPVSKTDMSPESVYVLCLTEERSLMIMSSEGQRFAVSNCVG